MCIYCTGLLYFPIIIVDSLAVFFDPLWFNNDRH